MLICELFSKPLEWSWTSRSDTLWTARFEVDGIDYQVYFTYDNESQDYPTWEVEFAALDDRINNPYGVSGTGHASTVFATVLDIIKDFKSTHKEFITFTADEPSRKKLYTSLVKKLAQGYTIDPLYGTDKLGFTVR